MSDTNDFYNALKGVGEDMETLKAENARLRRRCEALREAGDEIWYCYRHREPLADAIAEWVETRDDKGASR